MKSEMRKFSLPTLANEGLVNIEQYITAFYDHTFYGKIFADIFGFADFILHDLEKNPLWVHYVSIERMTIVCEWLLYDFSDT